MRACSGACVPQHMTLVAMRQGWSSPCIISTACCMMSFVTLLAEAKREGAIMTPVAAAQDCA